MNTIRRKWIVIAVTGLIVLTMGCLFPAAGAAPTVTPQASAASLPTLPPAVQTLSSAVSTPTPSSALDPSMQTATAQFEAVETLAAAAGLPTGTAQSALVATLLASMKGGASPTPGQSGGGGTGSGGNSGGSNGGSGSGSGSGNGSGSSGGNGSGSSEATATPTLPSPSAGPYVVKQIQTLGGEVLSGYVCKVTQPFSVTAAAPKVTFVFNFAPLDGQHGKVTYKYSIPSAGEMHDAAGTYTLSPLGTDGTLQLSLAVSDHVVFKGFDGNLPHRYKFNLVPVGTSPCP
jgi:hypothetical protein